MNTSGIPNDAGMGRLQTEHPLATAIAPPHTAATSSRRTTAGSQKVAPGIHPATSLATPKATSRRVEKLQEPARQGSTRRHEPPISQDQSRLDDYSPPAINMGSLSFVDAAYAMTQEEGIRATIPQPILDAAWASFIKAQQSGSSNIVDPSTRRGTRAPQATSSKEGESSDHSSSMSTTPGYALPSAYSSKHGSMESRGSPTRGRSPSGRSRFEETARRSTSRCDKELPDVPAASSNPLASLGRSISNTIGLTRPGRAPSTAAELTKKLGI